MWYLLQLEWKKWHKHLLVRILVIFYAILLPSILLLIKKLPEVPPEIGTKEVLYIFPTVWEYLAYIGNWLSFFFLGFLSVIMISTEYGNRTLRQNVIDGLSRRDFVLGKLYLVGTIALSATLYYVICALVIGFFHTEVIFWPKIWQHSDLIFRYFLATSAYMIFGLLVGFLVRHSALALILYMSYIMVLEPLLRWGVHQNITRHRSMHFYPMNAVEDLLPAPNTEIAAEFMEDFGFTLFLTPAEAVITTLLYSSLFIVLIFLKIRKEDL